MKKTIGILGGMGPLATVDLFKKIVDITDTKTDRDHVRVCIDSNTEIPDRTAAILYGGESPLPELTRSARYLQNMGADVIILPCNTSHYFLPQLQENVEVPILNMLQETALEAKRRGLKKVGLLATDGTVQTGIYEKAFAQEGINMVIPDATGQQGVMDMIYKGVKAGDLSLDLTGFRHAMDHLFEQGAEVLILGCTELPLAFEMLQIKRPAIDPTLCLAEAAVRFVGAPIKK